MTEPSKMTDAELVRAVAERVMRWRVFTPDKAEWGNWYAGGVRFCKSDDTESEWQPLTNWNDTMEIVDAMRAKGWHMFRRWWEWCGITIGFEQEDKENQGRQVEIEVVTRGITEQRAILEAALLAIGGE